MTSPWPLALGCAAAFALSACTIDSPSGLSSSATAQLAPTQTAGPPGSGAMNGMIGRYAATYHVPEALIRRIIVRESGYNPSARNGPYMGLMQIRYDTARSMGYSGSPAGLLNADTNLRYGVKYLSGAYIVANGNPERAVGFYASGYYYDARRLGLLDEVGLKRGK